MGYRKVGAATSSKRRIQPYHVGEIDGGWYVIGYDGVDWSFSLSG